MSKSFTLDSIREAAEEKYSDVTIDGVVLLNALRLPKEKRKVLSTLQDRMTGDEGDVDQVEVFRDALRAVAKSESKVDKLLDEVGDDLTVLVELFNVYANGTKVGEASASQD